MMDRLLNVLLRGCVVTLMFTCVVTTLTFLYSALFALIGGRLEPAGVSVALALTGSAGVYLLCRYRNDLVYG
jgi:hypothetical protein